MDDLTPAAVAFGGSNEYSGVSTSRTLMLQELSLLLERMPADRTQADYKRAVIDDNVLLKPSASTRSKTYSYLRDRYGLDPAVPVFRLIRLLWTRDEPGRPLMALLVAALRDPVLRATVPTVINRQPDLITPSTDFARIIDGSIPGKFGGKTLKAAGERITSTFSQSGHLRCQRGKPCVRQRVVATPGSATLALLIASLSGSTGRSMLESPWVRILDSPGEIVLAEAQVAASRGWLEIRHSGDVLEITFYRLCDALGLPR